MTEKAYKIKKTTTLLTIIYIGVSCILLLLIMLVINRIPTYRVINIQLPTFEKNGTENKWFSQSQTIFNNDGTLSFLWSRNAVIDIPEKKDTNWVTIIDYFDKEMRKDGWVRNNANYAPCWLYLPEANFLPENSTNGFVFYRQDNYKEYKGSQKDFVCLAVWQSSDAEKQSHNYYHIVLMTVRPQLFNKIISFFIS